MGLFNKKNDTETKKGLQLQVNHTLITKDQADVFTEMVKDTVKILIIGAVVATAAGFAMRFGADYLSHQLITPN